MAMRSLEVGDQVPIATGSATVLSANNAVVNTVDYKNTGVILHVQPHVNYNGSVLLDIDQVISEPTGTAAESHPHDFDARGEKHDLGHLRSNGAARRHDPGPADEIAAGRTDSQSASLCRRCFRATGKNRRFAPSSSCSFDRRSFGTAPTPRWSPRSFARRCAAEKPRRSPCPRCSTSSLDRRSDGRTARRRARSIGGGRGAEASLIGAVGVGAVLASIAVAPGGVASPAPCLPD